MPQTPLFYAFHNPAGNGAAFTIPADVRTNGNYGWLSFTSAERCAAFVAALPMHRAAVALAFVPARVREHSLPVGG